MLSGNTSEARDSCGGPDESFLFLLTSAPTPESDCPEIGLAARERRLLLDRFGAPSTPLETPGSVSYSHPWSYTSPHQVSKVSSL